MGHYEVNEHLDIYSQAMFYDYTSDAQIAFSGNFFSTNTINCDNPFLSAQQAGIICGANAGVAGEVGGVYVGRRLVEGNPRNDHIRLQSFRILGGVRGEIMEGWNYDAFFQYANTHNAQQYQNDVSTERLIQAMDVVDLGGGPQCRDTSNGCVPFNPWSIGGISPAAAAFVSVPSFQDGDTFQYMGQLSVSAEGIGVAQPEDEDFIKRVAGLPGDVVEIRRGQLYVNGEAIAEPYLATEEVTRSYGPVTVPDGMLFVWGDNRLVWGASGPEREEGGVGFVPVDRVIGRAFVIVWPPGHWGGL